MIDWGDAAERINAVFEKHGFPPIKKGTLNWAPILADNIEKLAARVPPRWATHYTAKVYFSAMHGPVTMVEEIPR